MTLNTNLAISEHTLPAPSAEKTSTSKETDPARSSIVGMVRGNSGVERFDSAYFVRKGSSWTVGELEIMRRNRHLRTTKLQALLPPSRSKASIQGKRDKTPRLGYRKLPFTKGEDEEIRRAAPTKGATSISHILPHRTPWDIRLRARTLGIQLFNYHDKPLAIVGEPLADAIRQRAREDGFSMRGLDCELNTGGYFTNVASHRARRGSGPYMPAIRKAIEFFEAELVTGPDGAITIDWKDE
jgi:hypothetical protein